MKRLDYVLLCGLVFSSCMQTKRNTEIIGGDNNLSTITLDMSDKFSDDQLKLLTGYNFTINPVESLGQGQGASCKNPTNVNITAPFSAGIVRINKKVRQGCNYSIGLQIGSLSADKLQLSKVYFTNLNFDGLGYFLEKNKFGGQSEFAIKLEIRITKAGVEDGLGVNDDSIDTGSDMTSINVGVKINYDPPGDEIQVIELAVVNGGYEPSTLSFTAGIPVILNITRKEVSGCGSKIIFPDFNKEVELPLNQTIRVNILPNKTGEFGFSCGMNMYKGKIVVLAR